MATRSVGSSTKVEPEGGGKPGPRTLTEALQEAIKTNKEGVSDYCTILDILERGLEDGVAEVGSLWQESLHYYPGMSQEGLKPPRERKSGETPILDRLMKHFPDYKVLLLLIALDTELPSVVEHVETSYRTKAEMMERMREFCDNIFNSEYNPFDFAKYAKEGLIKTSKPPAVQRKKKFLKISMPGAESQNKLSSIKNIKS